MKKKSLNKSSTKLGFNLEFQQLYSDESLILVQQTFLNFFEEVNPDLCLKYQNLTKDSSDKEKSAILIECAQILEDFLAQLFKIEPQNTKLQQKHHDLAIIYKIKKQFIQRFIAKKYSSAPDNFNFRNFLAEQQIITQDVDKIELALAHKIAKADDNEQENLELYCRWALFSKDGQIFHQDGALFILPQKIDHQNLVSPNIENDIKSQDRGFNLVDQGYNLNRNLSEANYCIFCHNQGKDSCRTGIFDNKDSNQNPKTDPLGIELSGCPLDEKISEMNLLKSQGFSIAALAMATIDNPMIAGTGHRICNDCMKSCIYQKQDPVNIPQIESRILKDVLTLPFGFEIYSLLTRWNPLNITNTLPQPKTNKKVLICGLGPAGYTLSHHLLNEGHDVIAIDGLKIEPLHPDISGINELGQRQEFKPIKYLDEIYEPLSKRQISGFGGVAEYGITVRWDKNFLKVIRLLLERRSNFQMFGGIRFGSSINDTLAFKHYGFDHIALCIGAGKPKIIDIKNNFAKGIRLASDFLMSLQLTGAFKEELFTNLQIRLPIIVIGGGLTAIDTACEAQSYYFTQIKKFAHKVKILGKDNIWPTLSPEEKQIAQEFLDDFAKLKNNDHNFTNCKILYRKKIQQAPSYRLNHEELKQAFRQNVEFIEETTVKEAILDDFGHIKAVKCHDDKLISCKSLLIAAGTLPNTSPASEDKLDLKINGKYFTQIQEIDSQTSFINKINDKNQAISFFGDLHPNFEGNVVKAMASAQKGYKSISQTLNKCQNVMSHDFWQKINHDFIATIYQINRLSDHVIEITIKAPLLAKNTKVGQIFRLQNFHQLATKVQNQIIAMENVAVTALTIDQDLGLISGIVVETGGSTSLIQNFQKGQPCIFMGPSGRPTTIPKNQKVIFIGGGRGNQPLTALAQAFTNNGCEVTFFAGYKRNNYVVNQNKMEENCHQVIYAIEDENPNLQLKKANSKQFQGNVIDCIKDYFKQNETQQVNYIFTIANNYLMHEIAKLRHQNIIPAFNKAQYAITSLNSPMQCMMKGVCAQCLQKRVNDQGQEEYFYSCADQDQNMDKFNFQHLHYRCEQNSLSEKIAKLWITHLKTNSN